MGLRAGLFVWWRTLARFAPESRTGAMWGLERSKRCRLYGKGVAILNRWLCGPDGVVVVVVMVVRMGIGGAVKGLRLWSENKMRPGGAPKRYLAICLLCLDAH